MKMGNFNNPLFLKSWSKIYHEDKDLAPRLAYKAKALHDYLAAQNKRFFELRESILKKYANKDEKGELIVKDGNYMFKDESLNDVNKEFAELLDTDLEPAPPSRIKIDDLEKDNVKLSGPDVAILSDLLDFGDENKSPLSLVPTP